MRVGIADLPLHGGRAPPWLFQRMVRMGGAIAEVLVEEYGREVLLQRLSDPFWLQCFGNVMGWDWDSSGMGTVVTGALKEALGSRSIGVKVAGGKGRASRRSPDEIRQTGRALNLPEERVGSLVRASRLSAKVDNAAVQDQHQLYHHAFILSEDGSWVVIQQGMNSGAGYARRYHWYWKEVSRFDETPHEAIVGRRMERVLDMTSSGSEEARKASVDAAREDPRRLIRFLRGLRQPGQSSLRKWTGEDDTFSCFSLPTRLDWEALRRVYEFQPRNYEELLAQEGIGPAAVRTLAYVSEAVYGAPADWKDPVKFTFALGGKDGIPYPVDKRAMDRTIEVLEKAIGESRMGRRGRLEAVKRLRRLVPA